MSKFLIVDVSNLFHRSFWGSDPLTTSGGMMVQGLHGFVRGMNALMRDHKPDYIALAMESRSPSFRKSIEPLYKANRSEPSDDLKNQLQMLPRLIEALGYKTYRVEGFEADDVIGTLAVKAKDMLGPDGQVYIVSSDKDFSQLVDNKVKLLDLMKGAIIDEEAVFNKYGVWPWQFVDYLAIVGDSSDNIKGIDGIGPKGAAKLISQYNNVDRIFMAALEGKISGATGNKVLASSDAVKTARRLAQIVTSIEIDVNLKDMVYKGPDKDKLRQLFRELEFKELEATMLGQQVIVMGGVQIGVRS
jgi:DNA polymerase-1